MTSVTLADPVASDGDVAAKLTRNRTRRCWCDERVVCLRRMKKIGAAEHQLPSASGSPCPDSWLQRPEVPLRERARLVRRQLVKQLDRGPVWVQFQATT